ISAFSDNEATSFRKNDIGFVFQDYMLLDSLTIRENISVALSLKNVDSSKINDLINNYAKRFNLYEQLEKYPYQLSGGQRQRVSIIRAIIKEPEIIFADEPTGALDLKSSEETMMILSEINKTEKVTILMVTHDVLSASYADRVVLLKDGKLHLEIDKEDCGETFYDVISQALSDRGE
ncbi:TPA: ABC transporter ATP-binding protein, partial [Streptococcus pyogenes]|nr:ABC transporter ATP-binding protein [Streptococcus pyogenes]